MDISNILVSRILRFTIHGVLPSCLDKDLENIKAKTENKKLWEELIA
jgi:hypothetical protein